MSNKKINKEWLYVIVGIMLVGLLAIFIIIATGIMGETILDFDIVANDYMMSIRSPWLNNVFKVITNLANPIFMGIVGVILIFTLKNKKEYIFALFLNMGLTALLNLTLKSFFVRSRPDSVLSVTYETGYSFPSGHAMFALAFYGFLIYLILHTNLRKVAKILLTISLSLNILLIGFSRIYLGVHYASDVIGAFAITIVYLIIFVFVFNKTKMTKTNIQADYKKHNFLQGFKYAIAGIKRVFIEENNLFIQFSATMLVIVFGVFLRISSMEWCVCLILCFLVMAFEMFNTAIENICDKITLEKDAKIARIKDISAGAVLTMSICAFVVALIIFVPKVAILFI